MEEMKFTLVNPVEVSIGGDFDKVYELSFIAPSYQERKQAGRLAQMLTQAEMDVQARFVGMMSEAQIQKQIEIESKREKESTDDVAVKDKKKGEKTPEKIKEAIMGSNVDVGEFYDICAELFSSVCFVADGVKIKTQRFADIDLLDFEKMCFEYVAFFIAPR